MTIAACFKFDEGILFCADTKITTGVVKTNQTKILATTYGQTASCCTTVFTFAGAVLYARAAITDCQRSISRLDLRAAQMEDIRKAIESNLVGFYQNHIYPKPDRDRMDFTLLIGVWLHGETRMFMTENAVVVPVNDYECIGAGAYLARYWVRQFFASEERGTHRKSPTMKDITLISTYALNSAMEYDEYCGGEAEFLVMKTNGEIGNDVSLYPFEDFPGKIHRVLWTMLRKLVHATDSVDVYGATEDFFQEVRNISEQGGKWLDHISEVLRKSIEGPEVPAVKPTPGGPLEAALGVATESTETDSP